MVTTPYHEADWREPADYPQGTLTAMNIADDNGWHVVVVQADQIIWIADDLMAAITNTDRTRYPGAPQLHGNLIQVGTPGEGMGRLTYRLTGRGESWHIAELQETSDQETERTP